MTQKELIKRYEQFFGKKETQLLLEMPRKIGNDKYVRVNISKTTPEEVEKFLKSNRVKFSKSLLPYAYNIERSFFNLSSSLPMLSGEMYMQDIASQLPVHCIDFKNLKKKVRVLDMAAAPGSKTTQLADLLTYHKVAYEIIALEPEKKRLKKLMNNIQKQGFEHISVFNVTGQEFEAEEKFDIILLDAPCSGNLVGDKGWLEKRTVVGIKKMAALQRELLEKASQLLAQGGILIYSTCSIEPEEDEENVKWAVENLDLVVKEVQIPLKTQNTGFGYKLLPYKSKTQGFFICYFHK